MEPEQNKIERKSVFLMICKAIQKLLPTTIHTSVQELVTESETEHWDQSRRRQQYQSFSEQLATYLLLGFALSLVAFGWWKAFRVCNLQWDILLYFCHIQLCSHLCYRRTAWVCKRYFSFILLKKRGRYYQECITKSMQLTLEIRLGGGHLPRDTIYISDRRL